MATIKIQGSEGIVENQNEVISFLHEQGVIYENWNITKLDPGLVEQYDLTEDEKNTIIESFREEIEDISERRGYKSWDVISLSSSTPNLEDLLRNFQQEHHHTDDEVRFIVSGHGVFIIQGRDGNFFEVHLNPGDLISVPENIRHYFTLSNDKQVVAIRIFVTKDGWVPIY
jgi:1,2-dihydroxy-3-keto-5-methylthiopentene dioxygenase